MYEIDISQKGRSNTPIASKQISPHTKKHLQQTVGAQSIYQNNVLKSKDIFFMSWGILVNAVVI